MEIKEFLPGYKVDIRTVAHVVRNDEEAQTRYVSQIFDVSTNGEILIHMPTNAGKLVILQSGVRYEFVFNTNNGLFKAEGEVTRRAKREGFYLLAIKLNTKLEKFQRREFFRLDCMMPLLFTGISDEIAHFDSMAAAFKYMRDNLEQYSVKGLGTILDISAGGIRFTTSEDIREFEYLMLQFQLEYDAGKRQAELIAKKVSQEYKPDSGKYEVRLMFLFKKDAINQEDIVKYVFEAERKKRRRD